MIAPTAVLRKWAARQVDVAAASPKTDRFNLDFFAESSLVGWKHGFLEITWGGFLFGRRPSLFCRTLRTFLLAKSVWAVHVNVFLCIFRF